MKVTIAMRFDRSFFSEGSGRGKQAAFWSIILFWRFWSGETSCCDYI